MIRKYRTPEQFAYPEAEKHVYTQEELTALKDMAMHKDIQSQKDQNALCGKFAAGLEISKRKDDYKAVRRRLWGMVCRYADSAEWLPVRSTKIKRGPWTWGEEALLKKRVKCTSEDLLPMDFEYYACFFNRTVEDVIDKFQHLQNDGRTGFIYP